MTAAEAAASIAAQTAAAQAAYSAGTLGASSGVFSLDQLVAMGKANAGTPATPDSYDANGNFIPGTPAVSASMFSAPQISQEWADQGTPEPGALIAGGGNATITAKGLQAGWYQIPGTPGAEYYDPASGQASAEFVKWANSLTPDDYNLDTGQPNGFIPTEGGPDAYAEAQAATTENINNSGSENPGQSGSASANFAAEIALVAQGYSNEDAQNRVLGIGLNQQFVMGANGQQETMAQVTGPQVGGGYRDVSTYSSMIGPAPTGTMVTDATGSYMTWSPAQLAAFDAWYAAQESDTNAAVAANTSDYQSARAGLQQENIIAAAKAAGQDPGEALEAAMSGSADYLAIAETGISSAQQKQIYDTYYRISDPSEQAAYIAAQDPGNLTDSLRIARTTARQGQTDWMTKNAIAPVVTYISASQYDNGAGGGIKTTYGDVTQTDATTGRSIMFGNVVTKVEYVGPTGKGAFGNAMDRLGGAIFGFLTGGPLGALEDSGFMSGINFNNPGKSTWGQARMPSDLWAVPLEAVAGPAGGAAIGAFSAYADGGTGRSLAGMSEGALSGASVGSSVGSWVEGGTWATPTLSSMGFSIGQGTALGYLLGGMKGAESGALSGVVGGMSGSMKYDKYGPDSPLYGGYK